MPRRGNVPKRVLLPDPVHQSPLVTKFINLLDDDKAQTVSPVDAKHALPYIVANVSAHDHLGWDQEAMEKYTTYTRDDMMDVLARYITEERRLRITVLPVAPPGAEEPTEELEPVGAGAE